MHVPTAMHAPANEKKKKKKAITREQAKSASSILANDTVKLPLWRGVRSLDFFPLMVFVPKKDKKKLLLLFCVTLA
jgi:hypothetical protein